MYDIYLDGSSLYHAGFLVIKRPDWPSPERRLSTAKVLGMDGSLIRDTGLYEDMDLTLEINFKSDPEAFGQMVRKLKGLLLGSKKLQQSDDMDFFWEIKTVSVGQIRRVTQALGTASVTLTLAPYAKSVSGAAWQKADDLFNPFPYIAKPIYRITGAGTGILSVNGAECHFRSAGELMIDTEKEVSTNQAGFDTPYSALTLKPGANEVSVTSDYPVTLDIKPQWRCL